MNTLSIKYWRKELKDHRFPAKQKRIVFSFFLSCMMSFLVSGIATIQTLGRSPDFVHSWFKAWLCSWVVAFPIVIVVAPLVEGLLPFFVKDS